jgi:quercetin dioxygenase-like cupin family protein
MGREPIAAAPAETTYVQGGIKRTLLQKVDFPDGCIINTSIIEVPSATNASPHTHPGVEIGYVLGGEFNLAVAGQPDRNLKVGSSYAVPAGAVHYAKVPGDENLKVLCVFIIDKTQPLATVESGAS